MNMDENHRIKVSPSILSCDFAHLADEVKRVEDTGAEYLHIDVMDGHFVPNISIGPEIVAAINRSTEMFLDVHLMIYNPFDYIERFVESGADRISFHFEATEEVGETVEYIRRCGVKVGLAFSPETSESFILKYLDKVDVIIVMTVHPGFGGQKFMPGMLDKVRFIRDTCDKLNIREGAVVTEDRSVPPFEIKVDGGIQCETALQCVEAGANVLVSGSYLFESEDMAAAVEELRCCAGNSG